jgi:hypothetical protein
MGGCKFLTEHEVGQNFQIFLDVDHCEVESHRFCEIPVSGPGRANLLVIITGIAVPFADAITPDNQGNPTYSGEIYVKTDYIVNPPDEWKNIVEDNKDLLQATYVTPVSILNEEEGEFLFAVDEASTHRKSEGPIEIKITALLRGNVILARVAYQASILIHRPILYIPLAPA